MYVYEYKKLQPGDLVEINNHQDWGLGVVINVLRNVGDGDGAIIRLSNGQTYNMFLHSPTRKQAAIVAKAKR